MNSDDDFYYTDNYMKIDNTEIIPEDVAQMINIRFSLSLVEAIANKPMQPTAESGN